MRTNFSDMGTEVGMSSISNGVDTGSTVCYNRGMDLKTFINSMDAARREHFATEAGTTLGHLRNVMYGYSPAAPAMAVAIERLSDGQVTRQELRPTDWADIWPELLPANRPTRARQRQPR